jgi:hypothetical protein
MAPAFAARLALVIGNDSYRNVAPLRNARADAGAMARALEQNGFKVSLLQDVDERAWSAGLRAFKARVAEGDDVVVFYAGHGVQLGATNYLLPVDIRAGTEDQVREAAVPLQRVLDDLEEKKARFAMVIVDACRDNPFRAKGRGLGGSGGLVPTLAATGQMIIYSAGSGQQALDQLGASDNSPNGLFTRVFVREMGKPGQPVDRMLRTVRDEVARTARTVGHDQVPALYDQSLGDFYFRQGAVQAAATAQAAGRQPVMALAPFDGDPATVALLARVISSDLGRSGRFALAEPGTTTMNESRRPDASWQARGADYVVAGSTSARPDGRIDVRFRAWSVTDMKELGGQAFTVSAIDLDLRLVAHRIADWLHEKVTGIPGRFSTRAAKVTSMAGRYTLMVSDSDGANAQPALASPQPIGLPTWSSPDAYLAYVSLESGPPVFYLHTVKTGVRKVSPNSGRLVSACADEIAAFRSGPESARDDWLKDDWARLSSGGCAAAVAAELKAL